MSVGLKSEKARNQESPAGEVEKLRDVRGSEHSGLGKEMLLPQVVVSARAGAHRIRTGEIEELEKGPPEGDGARGSLTRGADVNRSESAAGAERMQYAAEDCSYLLYVCMEDVGPSSSGA